MKSFQGKSDALGKRQFANDYEESGERDKADRSQKCKWELNQLTSFWFYTDTRPRDQKDSLKNESQE